MRRGMNERMKRIKYAFGDLKQSNESIRNIAEFPNKRFITSPVSEFTTITTITPYAPLIIHPHHHQQHPSTPTLTVNAPAAAAYMSKARISPSFATE